MKRNNFICILIWVMSFSFCSLNCFSQLFTLTGPPGSGVFGKYVLQLTNNNILVIDPLYDEGGLIDIGAAYLYNGVNYQLISVVKGSQSGDMIGGGGYGSLPNGNFYLRSPNWANGSVQKAGALTWGSKDTGISGVISPLNSLVGTQVNDSVGAIPNGYSRAVLPLRNNNFVVFSPKWNNANIIDAGAVTLCKADGSTVGEVSSANSLVGEYAYDSIGYGIGSIPIVALSNGNFAFISYAYPVNGVQKAGMLTWCSGTVPSTGLISSARNLVGSKAGDFRNAKIDTLANGNFIVTTPYWDNGTIVNAGATTFINGSTGTAGTISSSISLVGSHTEDFLSTYTTVYLHRLKNGNFLVALPGWDNGGLTDAGSITWCNANTGKAGVIGISNSLIGDELEQRLGVVGDRYSFFELANGNIVLMDPSKSVGSTPYAGAVTFYDAAVGLTGVIDASNSIVGDAPWTFGGTYPCVTPLANGNYVFCAGWYNTPAILKAGAIVWCDGTVGRTGIIDPSFALIGEHSLDFEMVKISALSNGDYVVSADGWDNGSIQNVGAVRVCSGGTTVTDPITIANSIVGDQADIKLGVITTLTNNNFIVGSRLRSNGAIPNAGAIRLCKADGSTVGVINQADLLVGTTANDMLELSIDPLSNGNFILKIPTWDNGSLTDAGVVTWGNGSANTVVGPISLANSFSANFAGARTGSSDVYTMPSGNYVIRTQYHSPTAQNLGALTWCNGNTGEAGVPGPSRSLVGAKSNDSIAKSINILRNGYLVAYNPVVDRGNIPDVGAMTWIDMNDGSRYRGEINEFNSLMGKSANDQIGWGNASYSGITTDNYFYFYSTQYDNGVLTDAGAVSYFNTRTGATGIVNECNSILGQGANGSLDLKFCNAVDSVIIVGQGTLNRVYILNTFGRALNTSYEEARMKITSTVTHPINSNANCSILGLIKPEGANPVSDSVIAKVWVETSVPVHLGKPYVARHFEILPAQNAATATGKITLYFTQQEFSAFNQAQGSTLDLPTSANDALGKSNLRVVKYSGNSSNGTGFPGSYSGLPEIIDPNDADIFWDDVLNRWQVSFIVNGFGGLFLKTDVGIVPLTLLSFNGILQNEDAYLSWRTTNEQNLHSYDVERSTDGIDFQLIGNVIANNNAGTHNYNYRDSKIHLLQVPTVYYRLKIKDISGVISYSAIIPISVKRELVVNFYPNPVQDYLNLSISIPATGQYQVLISDNTGRKVWSNSWLLTQGNNIKTIPLNKLASGVYSMSITGNSSDIKSMFIKR